MFWCSNEKNFQIQKLLQSNDYVTGINDIVVSTTARQLSVHVSRSVSIECTICSPSSTSMQSISRTSTTIATCIVCIRTEYNEYGLVDSFDRKFRTIFKSKIFSGVISAGVSVPVQIPAQGADLGSNYWPRIQWSTFFGLQSQLIYNTQHNTDDEAEWKNRKYETEMIYTAKMWKWMGRRDFYQSIFSLFVILFPVFFFYHPIILCKTHQKKQQKFQTEVELYTSSFRFVFF